MKFFTASCFLHTFTTKASSDRPVCNHAGCEAVPEESTLLQLGQLKSKAKSRSKSTPDGLDQWAERAGQIDQRILTGWSFLETHKDAEVPNWRACIDQMEDDREGALLVNLQPATFDAWSACLDVAEQADGITAWLEGGGQPQSLMALSTKTNTSHRGPLQNNGQDCWSPCGGGGRCTWCGSEGACCRAGWGGDPAECGGHGGNHYHTCVLPVDISPTPGGALRNNGVDCWHHCGDRGGTCSFCGTEGVCCREGHGDPAACGGRGGRDYHTCILPVSHSGPDRYGLPQHCEQGLPNTDPCSCYQMEWRLEQHSMWNTASRSHDSSVRRVGAARAESAARCGWLCPTHADWDPAPHGSVVRPGEVWEMQYGYSTSNGFERTDYTETEISDSMSVSYGFEFYGVSGGASAETTRTTREGVSETLNNVHTTDMISARSVTWNSHGHAWQARATTRDTCGGSLIVTTPEFALTPSRGSRPQCLPGYCYNGNDDEYCCTCARGGELAGVLPCEIQRCPRQASATYLVGHGSGRSAPIAMNCGRELEDEERCEVACGDYGDFSGRATLKCDHGVVVVEDDLTDCQFER